MVEFLIFIAVVGFFAFIGLMAWLFWKISDWNYERKVNKQRMAFPELYTMLDDVHEIDHKASEYRYKSRKIREEIENILAEVPYLVPSDKEKAERKLADLRFDLKYNEEDNVIPLEEASKTLWEEIRAKREEYEKLGIKIL